MIKITESESKVTPAKKTITLKEIKVSSLHFEDEENGDITQMVIDALPEGTEFVDFKISVELPDEEVSDDE